MNSSTIRVATSAIGFAVSLSAAVAATPLREIEGRGIELGFEVRGTVYDVSAADRAMHVVTTLSVGADHAPVRIDAVLAGHQTLTLSTPRGVGEPARTIAIPRNEDPVSL